MSGPSALLLAACLADEHELLLAPVLRMHSRTWRNGEVADTTEQAACMLQASLMSGSVPLLWRALRLGAQVSFSACTAAFEFGQPHIATILGRFT